MNTIVPASSAIQLSTCFWPGRLNGVFQPKLIDRKCNDSLVVWYPSLTLLYKVLLLRVQVVPKRNKHKSIDRAQWLQLIWAVLFVLKSFVILTNFCYTWFCSYYNNVVEAAAADEHGGDCKCGAGCACVNCTCGH